MGEKKIKRKGYTLLEVILSVALIALLLIPISNMIMTAMKSSKRADIRQDGAVVGQQLLEELKTYENFATNTPNLNLLDGTSLTQTINTETQTAYEGMMQDGKQKYEVNILVEKNEKFSGYMAATTTASQLEDNDYSCILKLITDDNKNKLLYTNPDTPDITEEYTTINKVTDTTKLALKIRKDTTNDKLDISLYDYTDGNVDTATDSKLERSIINDTKNRIKIVIDKSFTGQNGSENPGTIPIIVDSNSKDLIFDIVRDKELDSTKKTIGRISVVSSLSTGGIKFNGTTEKASKETFTARQNIKKQDTYDTTAIGDLYKITVVVKDKGEEIFRSQVSNNLN